MNVIADTWRQLVSRRLWPLALLLVAAAAAVPFLLAKEPEPVVPEPVPQVSNPDPSVSGDPVVALADQEQTRRRRVLGTAKDPFEPAPTPEPKPAGTTQSTPEPIDVTPDPSTDATGGSSSPDVSAPSSPSVPAPVTTPSAPKKTYPLYTVKVRFGDATGTTRSVKHVQRLAPLPSASHPVLIYMGPADGGKTAVFMVGDGIVPQGDGSCKPSVDSCETLHLRVGDTEFLDVVDPKTGDVVKQYLLELLSIKTKKTASAAKAQAAYARADEAGKRIAKAQTSRRPLRYSYDARRGVVKRLDKKAFKAAVARSAAAMAGGF